MADNRSVKRKKKKAANPSQGKDNRNLGLDLLGIALVALGLFSFISLLRDGTGLLGQWLRMVFFGLFGVGAYVAALLLTFGGVLVLLSYVFQLKAADWWLGSFVFWMLLGIAQLIGGLRPEGAGFTGFTLYIGDSFLLGKTVAGGGAFGGLLLWPLLKLLGLPGTWITVCALLLVLLVVWTGISIRRVNQRVGEVVSRKASDVRRTRDWKRSREAVKEFAALELEDFSPHAPHAGDAARDFEPDFFQEPVQEEPLYSPAASPEREVRNAFVPAAAAKTSRPRKTDLADIAAATPAPEEPPPYAFPPVALLSKSRNPRREDARGRAAKLEQTLLSFGVRAKVVNISCGPAVTQFEVMPAPGVRVNSITNIANDIALSLAAPSVRIEAPIPGKSAVGVEIPNESISTVKLRDVLDTESFAAVTSPTTFCLGRNIVGENVFTDIARMPHLLIAGATGSGKSVCLNSLIISLLYKASPQQVRLIMIDPKVVELGVYNGIPHLLIPVVTDPKKAAGALHWAVEEMERRYKLFSEKKTRNMQGYNKLCAPGENLPYIVIIIDELADLMMVAPADVEDAICRIAQLARAAGIHLVIATQRPSVDVITGLIKANIPSRIAFAVSSGTDSRTILDGNGAEKLLGRGDMLYAPAGSGKTQRVQGCFVTEEEVEDVVTWIVEQQTGERYSDEIQQHVDSFEITPKSGRKERFSASEREEEAPVYDNLLPEVVDKLYDQGQLSISMVQRKMSVGYARAARLVDQLEELGIITEGVGAKPRRFLKTRQEIEQILDEV